MCDTPPPPGKILNPAYKPLLPSKGASNDAWGIGNAAMPAQVQAAGFAPLLNTASAAPTEPKFIDDPSIVKPVAPPDIAEIYGRIAARQKTDTLLAGSRGRKSTFLTGMGDFAPPPTAGGKTLLGV
jgi:hypothetical protein